MAWKILSDHDCEGQAEAILSRLLNDPMWNDILSPKLYRFGDVGLNISADDADVWLFCQDNGYLFITGNRSTKAGKKSLEYAIRERFTENDLPVITIGNPKRVLPDPLYRQRCADKLAETIIYIEERLGVMRLYIP